MNSSKTKAILTFIGVTLLAISLPITVYIIKTGNLDFHISALESNVPVNVVVTDQNGSSFRVSWVTERPVYGGVKLSNNIEPLTESSSSSSHSILVSNLNPVSNYSFQLLSDGTTFAQTYSATTAAQNFIVPNHWLLGQVFATDGVSTQNGGIVTLQINNNGQYSQILSTVINQNGGFQFNLGTLLNKDNSQLYFWQGNFDVLISVWSGTDQTPVVKTYTMDLTKEIQIPNIYLGDINLNVMPGTAGN